MGVSNGGRLELRSKVAVANKASLEINVLSCRSLSPPVSRAGVFSCVYKSRRRVLPDLLADTKYPYNTFGKRPGLPFSFGPLPLPLPRRKARGVKWNQVFSVVLESDLHCHLVLVHCVAAHAAGFAVSGTKPCCADRPATGQSAAMNGVSRVLLEHSFFQHVFSTICSSLKHLWAMSVSLIARATAIGPNTSATLGQHS